MNNILYLPIEIADRELPGKLLVAAEAIKKKFKVVIIEQNRLLKSIERLPPGVILHKDHNDCNAYMLFKIAKKLGFNTTALDEEGLIYFNPNHYARSRMGEYCMDTVDVAFAWGEDQGQVLETNLLSASTQVIKVGNPRFDIHRLNLDKRKSYKNAKKILINTRFGSVNSGLLLDEDGYIERMRLVDEVKTEDDEIFRRKYFQFMNSLYQSFLEMIEYLAGALSDYQIMIRPHPAESSGSYKKLEKTYKNILVSESRSLEEDLLSHDFVIHNGCTTGIEALACGVPVFVYEPFPPPAGDKALPNHFGVKASSLEDLLCKISSYENYDHEGALDDIDHYIYNIRGDYAYTRIMNVIFDKFFHKKDVAENKHDNSFKNAYANNFKYHIKNIISYIPDEFLPKHFLIKKRKWCFVNRKFPDYSASDFSQLVNNLLDEVGFWNNIKRLPFSINKFGVKSYLLELDG